MTPGHPTRPASSFLNPARRLCVVKELSFFYSLKKVSESLSISTLLIDPSNITHLFNRHNSVMRSYMRVFLGVVATSATSSDCQRSCE